MNPESNPAAFTTTHWSVVLAAGNESSSRRSEALELLCRTYWYPLYAFVRRRGYSEHEAQDLTQSFFAHCLEKNRLSAADSNRGKFRTFLLTSLGHFLANEWDRVNRLKRGGGSIHYSIDDAVQWENRFQDELSLQASPETLFDRNWAESILDRAFEKFHREIAESGETERYSVLRSFVLGGDSGGSYATASQTLGISETGIRSVVHRYRKRLREWVRSEVAQTVAHPSDIDGEMRHLFAALADGT